MNKAAVGQSTLHDTLESTRISIKNIHNQLSADVVRGKLPETIFKEYFLPRLTGKVVIDDGANVISDWISIAGSPMAEVDIIDKDNKTLFAVPPLMSSNVLDILNREVGKSFNDINVEFELHNNNIPAVANSFLNKELLKKAEEIKTMDSSHLNPYIERWKDIYSRYGLEDPTAASNTDKDNDEDDLIYG